MGAQHRTHGALTALGALMAKKSNSKGASKAGRLTNLQSKLVADLVEYFQRENLGIGHHLTEEALAREFGVSRSPVAAALRFLGEFGIVKAKANHGFRLAVSGRDVTIDRLPIPEIEDRALYDRIVADRLKGDLPDDPTEAELMRKYNVTRGVLTSALVALLKDGTVERSPGYGWRFAPTLDSSEARRQSYDFRILIEPPSILLPTFEVDLAALARLRSQHEQLLTLPSSQQSRLDFINMNTRFHETIASWSGNTFVLQALRKQNRLRRLVELRGAHGIQRVIDSCNEHLAIIDALESGDFDWASKLMHRHLDIARDLVLKDDGREESAA